MRTRQQLFDSKSRDFKSAAIKGVQTPQVQEWLGLSRAPPSEARRQLLARVIARSKEAPKRRGLLYFRLTVPSTKKRGISKEEQAALNLASEERAARKARPTTLRNLTSLSRSTLKTLRPLLYGRIVVADCGQTLVQSLASNKELPPMVHSILFLPSALAIEGPMWERVLHELTNLTQLGISGHTRLTTGGLNDISFKLLSFISFSNCPPVWADLLQLQLRLEVLEIRGDLLGPTPLLPAIRSACLDPAVAAKMLECNCLPDVEFFLRNLTDQSISCLRLRCTQFFRPVDNVPTLLKELYSLVFDSDPSWVRTSIQVVYGKGRGLTAVVRVQVWRVRVRVGLGPKPYNPEPAPYRHQFYRGSKPAVKARFGVLIIDTSYHTGQVVVSHEHFGGAAKKKEGKTEKGTGAEDRGELKLEQAIIDLVWALIWPRHWPNKRPSVAEHYKAFAVRLLAIDLPQLRKVRFVSTYCHPNVSELVELLHSRIEKSILSNYCRPPAPIQSVGSRGAFLPLPGLPNTCAYSISSWEDLTTLIYQDSNNIFNTCIFSGLMPFRLVRKTRIRDGKPVNRVRLVTVEQEIIPRQPEMDWYTRRLNTQRARRLQRLEDLRLARPYERPGPETPLDEDWHLSMQSLADFAEEMVAEQEQGWQDAFQRIADWHIENFQPPPIPRIGTEAYFEFVRNRRERFAFAQGPLVNGRHDFPRPHGIGNLQYGDGTMYVNVDNVLLNSIRPGTRRNTLNDIQQDLLNYCSDGRKISSKMGTYISIQRGRRGRQPGGVAHQLRRQRHDHDIRLSTHLNGIFGNTIGALIAMDMGSASRR
ncbi:hypothetical protein C8J57DRAFT_1230156 [Mycena rebaudengoi]|nr:hypothetical protein C8J57DRAFT_1230156 [Mycena rebaudengoi]